MASVKSIVIPLMAAVIFVLCGAAGCGQGNEIEIYIPQTTAQSQIGQIYVMEIRLRKLSFNLCDSLFCRLMWNEN